MVMKKTALILALIFAFSLLPTCLSLSEGAYGAETAFYVSPDGNDEGCGTVAQPFQSMKGAKDYLASCKEELTGDTVVYFREGEYAVRDEITFGSKDAEGVTYRAYPGEKVVFTATTPISGFSETTVNNVKAYVANTDLRFNSLYHKEKTITTPRYPEKGNFTVKSIDRKDDLFTEKTTYWESSRGNTSFNADLNEVTLRFSQPDKVYARITHGWLDEISKITFFDQKTGKVGLARPATFNTMPGDVYWFENVFEALDSPGEWYLDESSNKLYYVPFEGEEAENVVLYAPINKYLLSVDGCNDLTFKDLIFWGSEWTLSVTPEGNGVRSQYNIDAYQASIECDAAVNVQNADNVNFDRCEFLNIGNTALKYVKNCHDCKIENSVFSKVGSTAIAIYGENVKPDAENATEIMSGFTVSNNLIEGFGRNTYESTGVHFMYAKDSVISNNEIHDGYYTGLSCGWIWGHEYQVTRNVKITDNLIYDIGQGWLSDLGGMYLLGEQPGTVIARNVIYNVTRGKGKNDYGGNGIYTDAGSSYFTIEQNLIYDCAATGLNIGGYNKSHTVRYNVVAFCKLSQFDPGYGDGNEDDCTVNCYGNVFYSDDVPVILDLQKSAKFVEKNNILWDKTNGAEVFGSTGYTGDYEHKTKISVKQASKNGFLASDLFTDPLFTDAENRVFTFREDSPVYAEGFDFSVCDFSLAGTKADDRPGFNEYARGQSYRKSDLSAYPNACSKEFLPYWFIETLKEVFPVLRYVLAGLVLALGVLLFLLKSELKLLWRIFLLIATPVAVACFYPLYLYFENWTPAANLVFAALFGAATSVPCMVLIKKKWLRILPPVLFFGSFAGLGALVGVGINMGATAAMATAEVILFTASLICYIILIVRLRRSKKKKK